MDCDQARALIHQTPATNALYSSMTDEDSHDWMGARETSPIEVDDLDLLTTLDHLDKIDPSVQKLEWYKRLSAVVDDSLKPMVKATAPSNQARH